MSVDLSNLSRGEICNFLLEGDIEKIRRDALDYEKEYEKQGNLGQPLFFYALQIIKRSSTYKTTIDKYNKQLKDVNEELRVFQETHLHNENRDHISQYGEKIKKYEKQIENIKLEIEKYQKKIYEKVCKYLQDEAQKSAAAKTQEVGTILMPAKNSSKKALKDLSTLEFKVPASLFQPQRAGPDSNEKIKIDLAKTEEVCCGMAQLFIHRVLRTREAFSNKEINLIRVSEDFYDGAPLQTLLLQSTKTAIISSTTSSPYVLSTKCNKENKLEIEGHIKNLPPGIYMCSLNWTKGGIKTGHSLSLVKMNNDNYYLFDPNYGLIHFKLAEKVAAHLQKYYKEAFFAIMTFVLCDGNVSRLSEGQGEVFSSFKIISDNAFLIKNQKITNSYLFKIKTFLYSLYCRFINIIFFFPYILLAKFYIFMGKENPISKAARIYRIFCEDLFTRLSLEERMNFIAKFS